MRYASGVATAKWVLVVDDDEDNRDSVVDVLQSAGYVAAAAPGGTAALRMMGEAAPALVVSDLRMNGMDGRELLTRTRQMLGSSAPPFVFLTGLAPEFADAAATFVSKPCDFDQLLGVVGRHCRA
jgi:two-component system, NtrC family, C4-dicarboxylate transport response regulator DctD